VLAANLKPDARYKLAGGANVFHAGMAIFHPLNPLTSQQPGGVDRRQELGADILRLCN